MPIKSDEETFAESARLILETIADHGHLFEAADRRRIPTALKKAAAQRRLATDALKSLADRLKAQSTPAVNAQEWSGVVAAAILAGMAWGTAAEFSVRSRGAAVRSGPLRQSRAASVEIAALAALKRAPASDVAAIADRVSVQPESVRRKISRVRAKTRRAG